MEIFLVRHTRVALSKEYCYGISDVELAESWEQDIAAVKAKLADHKFHKAFTSPLKRCKMLSAELVDAAQEDNSLLEMSLGDWELQKWADLDQEILEKWMDDFVNIVPPNSECFLEYSMKPVFFYDQLVSTMEQDEQVLLVSHSGAIRSIICHVLNLPLANAFHFELDFGSVSKIEVNDGWSRLKFLNY